MAGTMTAVGDPPNVNSVRPQLCLRYHTKPVLSAVRAPDQDSLPAATVGNFNSFPRINALMEKFNSSGTTIKPFWLSHAKDQLDALGLLDENDAWATATERLYAMCWKIDIEDLRRNQMISGYEWWTIQDYWTGVYRIKIG